MTKEPPGSLADVRDTSRFRGDIEGLRAIAVALVLVYHAGVPAVAGYIGVDVFFVISGYLITTLLVNELMSTGRISLPVFYARRAKRLLPGAAAMLAVTGLLTLLLMPVTRWLDTAYDILASVFYVQNWRLATLAVDYQAQDAATSPLQHFWSLAVEEQFYLIWPPLLLAVTYFARRARTPERWSCPSTPVRRMAPLLTAGMLLVAVPSLGWSIWYTLVNPDQAYFVTTTRLWELAVGGGVAILATRFAALSARSAAVLGWTGLVGLCVCAAMYSESTAFPGIAALGPVLATAAIIAGGHVRGAAGPTRMLSAGPMRWLGKLSYSSYLWHWPLLIIAAQVLGPLSLVEGIAVVSLSFIPAYLTFTYVEDPVRRAPVFSREPTKAFAIGGASSAVAVLVAFVLVAAVWPPPSSFTARPVSVSADVDLPEAARTGALVLADQPRDDPAGSPVDSVAAFYPSPLQAPQDVGGSCISSSVGTEVETCVSGDNTSDVDVALIGDSHAAQWTNALSAVARDRGWRLTSYTKANCPFTLQDVALQDDDTQYAEQQGRPPQLYGACSTWRDNVVGLLSGDDRPDMIFVSGVERPAVVDGVVQDREVSTGLLTEGFRRVWQTFISQSTQVVVLADTPRPQIRVPECVSKNSDRLTACSFGRSEGNTAENSALTLAARLVPEVTFIDLSDAICPTERCAPIIGGVLVYRDTNHLTASYVGTLAPRLEQQIPPIS